MSIRRLAPAVLLSLLLAAPLLAQETAGDDTGDKVEQREKTVERTSSIKKISLSFGGGYYSGDTYYELPPMSDRAQVEAHSFDITLFNGQILDMGTGVHDFPNGWSAPRKEIDSGTAFQGAVGFYLSDAFHIDLRVQYATSKAILSVEQMRDGQPTGERIYGSEADGWVDSDFKSYTGGMDLTYDLYQLQVMGLTPYAGFGIGGVINSFSVLEDKTGLYFNLFGGFLKPLGNGFQLNARLSAATYPFETEEVHYTTQVTMLSATIGLTKVFDVHPIR